MSEPVLSTEYYVDCMYMSAGHGHCDYCHFPFEGGSTGDRDLAVHLRDKHPEVWAADEELRTYSAENHGVC